MCWEEGTTLKCLGTSDLNPTTRIEKKITQNNLKGKTTGTWCEQTRNGWRRTSITYTCRSIKKWTFRNHSEVISFDFFLSIFFFYTPPNSWPEKTIESRIWREQRGVFEKEDKPQEAAKYNFFPCTYLLPSKICFISWRVQETPSRNRLDHETCKRHFCSFLWIFVFE